MKKTFAALALSAAAWFPATWAADADQVQVIDPYARAVPPTAPASAAFMTLRNRGDHPTALVGAESDVAEITELHTHVHENGMMKMRPVARIPVPAKGKTQLKPGGYHIMLIRLKHPLKPGDKVHLTLRFADGSTRAVTAPVRPINGMGGMGHMHHGNMHHAH
ncbi:copper chaperone PCu(A)C [Sulfurivirga sp.]|uniref:copper chaperone PCu(A)C n=1 Tax=Sulfurivirga sp. TaxID=2614236 RepID=UPI0025E07C2F|nr:copper chaperone PCu(A)C [Sulfurivirga sp.]